MIKRITAVASILTVGIIAGCGGGSGTSTTAPAAQISGVVADGYLQNAEVFLDMNNNYQWDGNEPKTMTDSSGKYTLTVPAADAGKYPVVVHAIAGSTMDRDTNQAVPNSYVLCAPAGKTDFISPMSTLLQQKLAANPGLTMADAMTQLRNQMGMPAGLDMLADYIAGSGAGQTQSQYQTMHQVATQMATLMGSQATLVMPSNSVNAGRFQTMMGVIDQNLPGMVYAMNTGTGSAFMTQMQTQMQTMLMAMNGGSGSTTPLFTNMTSSRYFWNYSGSKMKPTGGGTMGM
ncbi:MAG: hypothetical protein CXR31_11580 [Geobacter sp.]|nr:MAG: hypothetical protein CXR31_11580 [Geobacter sp.]